MKEAEAAFQEALDNYRQLAKSNSAAYQPHVARTLNNLGAIYYRTQRIKEAEVAYQEELDIYRQPARSNPAAYQPNLATTLNNFALLHVETGNLMQAGRESEEAISINWERWKTNPTVAADGSARSLMIASFFQQQSSVKCQLQREAASIVHDPELRERVDRQMANCPPQ